MYRDFTVSIPVKMGVYVDLQDSTIGDEAAVKQMIQFLQKYYDAGSDKDLKAFDVDVKADPDYDGYLLVNFEGDVDFNGHYETDDNFFHGLEVFDDDECSVGEQDFLDSVVFAVTKAPEITFEFDRGGTGSTKDKAFVKRIVDFTDDCEFPDDDTVYFEMMDYVDGIKGAAADAAYDAWRDRKYESVIKNVLDGKQFNEALELSEKEFWEEQPEEVYSDADADAKQAFETELSQWKKKLGESARNFASSAMELRSLLKTGENDFDVSSGIDLDDFIHATGKWVAQVGKIL